MQVEFISRNPRTEEVLATFDLLTDAQVAEALAHANSSQQKWRQISVGERAKAIKRVGELLERDAERYASLIELEMGKLHAEALAEVKKCAAFCAFTAESAPQALAPSVVTLDALNVSVRHDGLGVILAVMPWNFPFWQLFRAALPLLMSGNTILLKHAPNTPQCALAIQKLFDEATRDHSILRSLFIDNDQIQKLIAHKTIKGVTLTGSKRAGIAVATAAAQAIKPCVLELGGSDPFIVFADANLEQAVTVAVTSRTLNNGQSCIAAKRFLIEQSVFDSFVAMMTEQMRSRNIGPLANKQQQQALKEQVDDAVQKGAKLHCGGALSEGKGYFYPPTVLSSLKPNMRVSSEEVFGPVACLWPFSSDNEALALANSTDYGLGATVFTTSKARIEKFAAELECGLVFVNDMVRSDQRFPFGGIKESGFGRELGARAALSFCNEKTVWITSA